MIHNISASGFFCLRTHLLPCDTLLRWSDGPVTDRALLRTRLQSIIETPVVREAIFLASPALDDAIAAWRDAPDSDRGRRAERSLVKYLARLAGRPTPFGLFAAVATGRLGRDTALEVTGPGACRRHTRLDNAWLFGLAHALNADPAVRAAARYRPNDSLLFAAGHGRYTEARPAQGGLAGGPVLMEADGGELGVVHAGPAQGPLGKAEAQGLHQVQFGPRIGAKAHDVARVGGNLGLEENDPEHLPRR